MPRGNLRKHKHKFITILFQCLTLNDTFTKIKHQLSELHQLQKDKLDKLDMYKM